ncbi:hypothetical protein, partial [Paenibacillus humicus]|uniref:hypothetical protein n=1 Tax=Paenibacillus humicus TaxID=412861 RepID=UPI001C3FCD4A
MLIRLAFILVLRVVSKSTLPIKILEHTSLGQASGSVECKKNSAMRLLRPGAALGRKKNKPKKSAYSASERPAGGNKPKKSAYSASERPAGEIKPKKSAYSA